MDGMAQKVVLVLIKGSYTTFMHKKFYFLTSDANTGMFP